MRHNPGYMDKPLSERISHIRPDDPCDFDWMVDWQPTYKAKRLRKWFGEWMGTSIMEGAHCAHYCGKGASSDNRVCKNMRHLYWATPKENSNDRHRHGTDIVKEETKRKIMMTNKDRIPVDVEMLNGDFFVSHSSRDAARHILGPDADWSRIQTCQATISQMLQGKQKQSKKFGIKSVTKATK